MGSIEVDNLVVFYYLIVS